MARIFLKHEKDLKGKWTGYYVCSACGERFKPNPSDQKELETTFAVHRERSHQSGNPHEDVNQAAARVVREATNDS